MTAEKFKRKLTAILSADVKGYSRLMGADEEATLRTLQEYKEVMASSIQHHRDRIVGGAGHIVLAGFERDIIRRRVRTGLENAKKIGCPQKPSSVFGKTKEFKEQGLSFRKGLKR